MAAPGGGGGGRAALPPRPPLPASIAVRNLFPPLAIPDDSDVHRDVDAEGAAEGAHGSSEGRSGTYPRRIASLTSLVEDRCAAASREVLLRLRLDIIATPSVHRRGAEADNVGGDAADQGERVLYSSEQAYPTSHPRWDHVNEGLPRAIDPNCNLVARFAILDDGEHDAPVTDKDSGEERWLAEVPLHPSKLRRLPASSAAGDGSEDRGGSGGGMTIPSSLPPNTILLHFDDGYTRVVPSVYWLLVQKGVIDESMMDPLKRSGSGGYKGGDGDALGENGEGETSVFDDKSFDVLGESLVKDANGGRDDDGRGHDDGDADASVEQSQSTYDDDRVFDLLGKPSTGDGDAQDVDRREQSLLDVADLSVSSEPNELTAEATLDKKEDEPVLMSDTLVERKEEVMPSSLPDSETLPLLPVPSTMEDDNATMEEVEELRRLVELERRLLEKEQQRVAQGTDQLRSIMQQVQQLESEAEEFMRAVGVERANLFRSEFRLEAHRLRLLQHLRLIFPIKLVPINIAANPPNYPQHQYTISGLPLPDDVHNPTVTDDQVSTAMGFLCHLVALTSKYLAIPLRFPVVCKFSRSAILFDRGRGDGRAARVVYPLFRERGVVDREQLDYGLMLLERDVDCLLSVRGVEFRPEWNALAKVDKLLTQVIEGGEAAQGHTLA